MFNVAAKSTVGLMIVGIETFFAFGPLGCATEPKAASAPVQLQISIPGEGVKPQALTLTITSDDPAALVDAVDHLLKSSPSITRIVVKFESKSGSLAGDELMNRLRPLTSRRGIKLETSVPSGSYTGETKILPGTPVPAPTPAPTPTPAK